MKSDPALIVLDIALAAAAGDDLPRLEFEAAVDADTGVMSDGGIAAAGAILVVRLASELAEHLGVTAPDIISALHIEYRVDEVFNPLTSRLGPLG